MILTATFNESYTVKMIIDWPRRALVDPTLAELVAELQAVYTGDESPAPAGFFELEPIGDRLVVTLERSIGDDLGCSNTFAEEGLTVDNVQQQLAAEYFDAIGDQDGEMGGPKIARMILQELTLRRCQVRGLPSQYPTLTYSITLTYPTQERADKAVQFVPSLRDYAIAHLGGTFVDDSQKVTKP